MADGGGVAFFLGERCDVKFFNDVLYRDGKGLFPAPLERQAELEVDRLEPAPDLEADEHFIFNRFTGKRNSYLQTVAVQRYFAVPKGWRPPAKAAVRVAAHLRNGAPLVVEHSFGKGRVMAFLTTAAPTWNNWAGNPGFVVVMQDLEAYLTQRPGDESRAGRFAAGVAIGCEALPAGGAVHAARASPLADRSGQCRLSGPTAR